MSGFSKAAKLLFALLAVASAFVSTEAANAAQADWKKDWEQTLAAAKKEGQVTIYIYRYEGLLHDFKRDFPGINVVSVTGRGSELTSRLMAERRAGRFIADVGFLFTIATLCRGTWRW